MEKELAGLAGEFAVASELCRRGIYAQVTLGNRKRTDLLVDTGDRLRRVEVKAKQDKVWPAVKGVPDEGLLILVSFSGKEPHERPDFYILTSDDWEALCRKHLAENPTARRKDNGVIVYKSGYEGAQLEVRDVMHCLEAWDKVCARVKMGYGAREGDAASAEPPDLLKGISPDVMGPRSLFKRGMALLRRILARRQ